MWSWHAHHVVKQQTLKRRRVPSRYIRTAVICVLLCKRCHEQQTHGVARVPLERIPAAVIAAVAELGPWAEDLLRREHPPADTRRNLVEPVEGTA